MTILLTKIKLETSQTKSSPNIPFSIQYDNLTKSKLNFCLILTSIKDKVYA